MKKYEYICLVIDIKDLKKLNEYSRDGWRVIHVEYRSSFHPDEPYRSTILEREIPPVAGEARQ
jgi:hypothetical protein